MKKVILTETKLRKLMVEMKFSQDIVFVSYLPLRFKNDKMKGIKEIPRLNKPNGGLWACPIDSARSWKEYINRRKSSYNKKLYAFYFKLKSNAKIYSIDTLDDLNKISTKSYNFDNSFDESRRMDFELLMRNGYDGIYVSENALNNLEGEREKYPEKRIVGGSLTDLKYGEVETVPGTNGLLGLYGWGVESICVFNPDVIEPISEGEANDVNKTRFNDTEYTPENGLKSQDWLESNDYVGWDEDTGSLIDIRDDEEAQKRGSWDLLDDYYTQYRKSEPTDAYMQAKKVDDTNKAWREHETQEKAKKAGAKRSMTNTLKVADKRPLIQKKQ
jgi:hypothetical protein